MKSRVLRSKWIAAGLALAMAFGCVGCGETGSSSTTSDANTEAEVTETETADSEAATEATTETAADTESANSQTEAAESTASSAASGSEVTMFASQATIEDTVLVDEADVKITASNLTYTSSAASLDLTIENNSNEELKFLSGTVTYSYNSVNGYMIDGGYVNETVSPGKNAKTTVNISAADLMLCGITDIAEIQLAFEIEDDSYKDVLVTGPRTIKTSIADSYDMSADDHGTAIQNPYIQQKIDYTLAYYGEDIAYDDQGIKLLSETVAYNSSGELILLLEMENNSDAERIARVSDISVNDVLIYSGSAWDSAKINPGKKAVLGVKVSSILGEALRKACGINEVGKIGVSITPYDTENNELDEETYINVSVPGVDTSVNAAGTEVLNENGIIITSLGKMEDPDSYNDNVHFLFLVENTSSETIIADIGYTGNSINNTMADLSCYSQTIQPGGKAIWDAQLLEYKFEDCGITGVDDISEIELAVEIRNEKYKAILDEGVAVQY